MRAPGSGRTVAVLLCVGVLASIAPARASTGGATGAPVRASTWPLDVEFPDVPASHPFATEIGWLADHAIADGYDDGTFRPAATVTRQAFAALLAGYDGNRKGPQRSCTGKPFTDVPVSHPFCAEIAWMKRHDLAAGWPDGTFRPAEPVSRQAFAAVLHRFHGDRDDGAGCPPTPFPDVPASSAFCDDIAWLTDHAIATGYDDGTFRPTAGITRQAIAAFFHRYDTTLTSKVDYDFDGDGDADIGWVSAGTAYRQGSSQPFFVGPAGDEWVAGDYDGKGSWEGASVNTYPEGGPLWTTGGGRETIDLPGPHPYVEVCDRPIAVPADYDGDGDTDPAWYDEGGAIWHLEGQSTPIDFGLGGAIVGADWCDVPVPADYDGDGDDDIAVYRPTDGTFRVLGVGVIATLGLGMPAPADYDGDGDADPALWHGEAQTWVLPVGVEGPTGPPPATAGSWPVPADYDGDGTDEPVVYFDQVHQLWSTDLQVTLDGHEAPLTTPYWLLVNVIRLYFVEQCEPDDCPLPTP
jgi:hypothetical protein